MISLDSSGRPQYLNNSKPNQHRGRLIKETALAVTKSFDIPKQQSLPKIAGAASEFRKQLVALNQESATDVKGIFSVEKLRRRVIELESENEKLCTEAIQNEQSIKNYRSFLAGLDCPKISIAVQTDSVPAIAPEVSELTDARNKIVKLESTNESLVIEMKLLKENTSQEISTLRKDAVMDRQRLAEMEEKNCRTAPSSTESPPQLSPSRSSVLREPLSFSSVTHQISRLKSDYVQTCAGITSEMVTFKAWMTLMLENARSVVESCRSRETIRNEELEALQDKYDTLKTSYSHEQSKWARASVDLANMQRLSQPPAPLPSPVVNSQGCDPLSPMADRNKRHSDFESRTKLLEDELEETKNSVLYNLSLLEILIKNHGEAVKQVDEVAEKHLLEIKATKHMAHVKDLGRVAAIRELTIEKEKYLSDLRYIR